MKDKYFLDSNITVYATDSIAGTKRDISRNLVLKGIKTESSVISTQVLSEFFVTVTKKIKKPLSISDAAKEMRLLSFMEVVDINYDLIALAINIHEKYKISYWDALIVSAAHAANCKTIYTEDMNAGQDIHGIRIINPFDTTSITET